MSLQSIAARARIEGMRALQQTVDRVLRRPPGGTLYLVRASAALPGRCSPPRPGSQ